MLRDGWNFHNDVAMVIENKSRSCFGFTYGDYNMFSAILEKVDTKLLQRQHNL